MSPFCLWCKSAGRIKRATHVAVMGYLEEADDIRNHSYCDEHLDIIMKEFHSGNLWCKNDKTGNRYRVADILYSKIT